MNINQLAEKLGITAEYIINVYTKRAWTVWLDFSFYIFLLILLFAYLGYQVYRLVQIEKKRRNFI